MESTPDTALARTTSGRLSAAWLNFLGRIWVWIFLLILVIFFSVANSAFLSIDTAMNIMITASPVLLLGLGQTFVIISGGIDLSVGWTMGLGSVMGALVMRALFDGGMAEVPAIAIGFLAGVAVTVIPGLVNGLLIARVKVPPFIATLGMYSIARGAALLLSGGNTVASLPPNLGNFGNGYLIYWLHGNIFLFQQPDNLARADLREVVKLFSWPVIVTAIISIVLAWVLARTRFGRRTYAIGGNFEAALRAGIPVRLHQIRLYVLAAVLAGVSGVLYTARFTGGSFQAGEANLLDSVAAVVIGGASLFGGTGNVAGTVVGSLIIAVLTYGLVIMNVQPFWQYVVVGCVVILAVIIDQGRSILERARGEE